MLACMPAIWPSHLVYIRWPSNWPTLDIPLMFHTYRVRLHYFLLGRLSLYTHSKLVDAFRFTSQFYMPGGIVIISSKHLNTLVNSFFSSLSFLRFGTIRMYLQDCGAFGTLGTSGTRRYLSSFVASLRQVPELFVAVVTEVGSTNFHSCGDGGGC